MVVSLVILMLIFYMLFFIFFLYNIIIFFFFFFFSSRRRHTRYWRDWSSDVCSSDLAEPPSPPTPVEAAPIPMKRASWLQRLKSGLARSSTAMSEGIASVLTKRRIDRSEERRVGKECRYRWAAAGTEKKEREDKRGAE